MFFRKEPMQETAQEPSEPEEFVYSFRYQICMKRHNFMEYISKRGNLEDANTARAEVLASLSAAMKDKATIVLFDSIGVQGEWLAWFYVGGVEEITKSKGGQS